jgi:signal transduction histidine kinase
MKLRQRLALTVLVTAAALMGGLAWLHADLERRGADQTLREYVLARMESGGREVCEAAPQDFPDRPFGKPDSFGPHHPQRRSGDRPPPDWHGPDRSPGDRRWPEGPGGDRRPGDWPPGGPHGPGGPGPGPGPPGHGGRMGPPRMDLFAYSADFVSANPRAPEFPASLKAALERGRDFASEPCLIEGRQGLQAGLRMAWQEGPCAIILARRPDPPGQPLSPRLWGGALILSGGLLLSVLVAAGPIVRRVRRLTAQVRRSASDRYATQVDVLGGDEVSQLAAAFNEAGKELRTHLERLERREETLRSFVANTTHDVMLPLTVLQGHLTAIRNRIDGEGSIDRETVLDSLEETHYMASLIQNLGAAVKLEAGEGAGIQRHPVNLNELVERVIGRHRPIARQREINLDYLVPEAPLLTEGDLTLLEQALSNVTHNAVRYNRPGGNVMLVLAELAGEPPGFSLRVVDDGPGLTDEMLSRITERSFRTDEARRRHPEGLGLGLHIAKSVARAHEMSFEIRHSQSGGLEVEFRGPLMPRPAEELCAARNPPPS